MTSTIEAIRGVNYVPANAVNATQMCEILPLFGEHRIGWYVWELMIGADRTRYRWPDAEPVADDVVFQRLLYPDGTPYSRDEIELLSRASG